MNGWQDFEKLFMFAIVSEQPIKLPKNHFVSPVDANSGDEIDQEYDLKY